MLLHNFILIPLVGVMYSKSIVLIRWLVAEWSKLSTANRKVAGSIESHQARGGVYPTMSLGVFLRGFSPEKNLHCILWKGCKAVGPGVLVSISIQLL